MNPGQHISPPGDDDPAVRLLWAVTRCDPDDPQPPWEDLHPDEQASWMDRGSRLRLGLIGIGWIPPTGPTVMRGKWASARDVPEGARFRAVGGIRVYQRRGDRAIRIAPTTSPVAFLLSNLDADPTHDRGYTEAL